MPHQYHPHFGVEVSLLGTVFEAVSEAVGRMALGRLEAVFSEIFVRHRRPGTCLVAIAWKTVRMLPHRRERHSDQGNLAFRLSVLELTGLVRIARRLDAYVRYRIVQLDLLWQQVG